MTETSTAPSDVWQQILDYSSRADPYPLYAELRKTPVVRAADGSFVVSTYREIVALLHDPRMSSDPRNLPELAADGQAAGEGSPGLPPNVIRTDPPEHDRIRRLLTWNFGPPHCPGRIDGMLPDLHAIVTSAIDGVAAKVQSGTTRFDVVDNVAYPFPVTVICRLLGVPREDEPRFQAMSDALITAGDPASGGIVERRRRGDKAHADLVQYFTELLDARRGELGDDLLSALLSGDSPGPPLSRAEVLSNAALLLVAGHETTVNLITNGMLTLLRHPGVLERLRGGGEPGLAARVVEELLRYEPPVQYLPNRNALDDIEIAGTVIPKGVPVTLVLAAGSRDPDVIPEPDRFDPDREHNEHMGFGGGVHYCFGAPLARPETQIALTELAHRLGNPRLVEDPPPYRSNPFLRGPRHLLVEIDGVDPAQPRPS
ncbi:MAG: cytochrome [Modestobacter sp.]|nr:cytochrome [Modestobacter sp.]